LRPLAPLRVAQWLRQTRRHFDDGRGSNASDARHRKTESGGATRLISRQCPG